MVEGVEMGVVLDAMPDAVTVHSLDGVIRYANAKAADLAGKLPADLVGIKCSDIFHQNSVTCPHENVVSSGRTAQLEMRSKDGSSAFRITVAPVRGPGSALTGYVRVVRDVTERVRAQEALLRAERLATLGQMISGIAHDVGTPLSIISGYAEYLLMRTLPGGPGHKELSTILNQTRRIAEFIGQLLDLARPEQGRVDAIGLKGFLDELLELLGHHLKKAGVRARLLCATKAPVIYGDSPRLRQALFNLVLNASQKVGNGGELELVLEAPAGEDDMVRLAVIGTESGGASHDFSQSLAEFLNPERTDGVLGLGLSLTRENLTGLGARVHVVDSGDGKTHLAVELPLSR